MSEFRHREVTYADGSTALIKDVPGSLEIEFGHLTEKVGELEVDPEAFKKLKIKKPRKTS